MLQGIEPGRAFDEVSVRLEAATQAQRLDRITERLERNPKCGKEMPDHHAQQDRHKDLRVKLPVPGTRCERRRGNRRVDGHRSSLCAARRP